jgi:PKD repeat protein
VRVAAILLTFSLAAAAHADTACPTLSPAQGGFYPDTSCTLQSACPAGVPATLKVEPWVPPFEYPYPPYTVQSCDVVTWHFGDGTPDVTVTGAATTTHTYAQRGIYQVSVTIANSLGSGTAANTLLMTADPAALVDFSPHFYSASEGAGSVAVTFQRTGNLSIASSVQWSLPCSSCGAPLSYHLQPGSGTVTFAPGESTKSIAIPIRKDNVYIGPTRDWIELRASDGTWIGSATSGGLSEFGYIDVLDDEPQPVASIADTTALRSSGAARFTIHLSAPMGADATFACYQIDHTAVNGVDYQIPANPFLIIPAGATSGSIDIPILNDSVPQPDKTFAIQAVAWGLYRPTIGRDTGTCTIVNDNFFLPPSLKLSTGERATLVIDAVTPFAADTVFPITTSDASVLAVPASVTISAGSSKGSIDVTALTAGTAAVGVQVRGIAGRAQVLVSDPIAVVAKPSALRLRA